MGGQDKILQKDASKRDDPRLDSEQCPKAGIGTGVDVAVVVVSFNTRSLTLSCLDSLCSDNSIGAICVVDNGSCDGSREALLQRACLRCSLECTLLCGVLPWS